MIVEYPHLTEKSMSLVDENNTIVFIVQQKATKTKIKKEIEEKFKVKVEKINTQINTKGLKKAYVKLSTDSDALGLATRLGMM